MDRRERMQRITRQEIVDAAFALFSTHGFAGTTVEMIAEQAVVSPRTVYRYFQSKEAIVFTGFEGEADRLIEAVRDHCATGVSVAALFAGFAQQLGRRQHEASFPTLAALMRDNPPLMSRADAWRRQVMVRVAGVVAEHRGVSEPSLEDRALAGLVVAVSAIAVSEWAARGHQDDLGELVLRAGRAVREVPSS